MSQVVYKIATASIDDRVYDLLARMTLPEKVAQLSSVWIMLDAHSADFAPYQGQMKQPQMDIDSVLHQGVGQLTRAMGSRPISPAEGARAINAFQRRQIEETRLGIPAIVHEECLTGLMTQGATQFPSPLNYGATWNPDLIELAGRAIGRQMRAVGAHQGLAPVADVVRDARWGRVEECMGEDPLLVGQFVTAYVRGMQGTDLRQGVVATLKHFAGYSGSEGGRNFAPVHAGRREMEDVFLVPFEMAIRDGGCASVMNSYAEIDGDPAGASRWLLTDVLRDRWGFDGIAVADYYTVRFLQTLHGAAADFAEASAAALNAGLDMELPHPTCFWTGVPQAIGRGLLDPEVVDEAVRRVLRVKFRLGLFEQPYTEVEPAVLSLPEDEALSAEIARQSMTLLANDGVLPLRPDLRRIAVIGPNALDGRSLYGNYSYTNHVAAHFPDLDTSAGSVSVVDAIRDCFPDATITAAQGCAIQIDPHAHSKMQETPFGLEVLSENISDDHSGIAAAVELARDAEVVVLVLGDKAGHFRVGSVGEGSDAIDLGFPARQADLARAVMATGVPVVIVLINGRPIAEPAIFARASAVLEAWFPGDAGGKAIGDVLSGRTNPGGKLTVTFPSATGIAPLFYNHKRLSRGTPGARSFQPIYPFGHGLSYTSFDYEDFAVGNPVISTDGETTIEVVVRNTGARAGDEIVQLYVQDLFGSVTRPLAELKGFVRVSLEPGEARRIAFTLHADMLSFTGIDYRRIVEPGEVRVWIGCSSAVEGIRGEAVIDVQGPTRVCDRQRRMTTPVTVSPSP